MKTIFVLFVVLLSVGAFGQCCQQMNAPTIPPAQLGTTWTTVDHPMRATRHSLAVEQDLRELGGSTMAQGERPVWEVVSFDSISLGEAAREYRKEHLAAPKAQIVWEKIGK